MLQLPRLIHLAAGSSEGRTPLNAFDNALQAAGVHNLNLVRVSSIAPQRVRFGELPELPVGTIVPTVYSEITSNVPGEVISASVGAGMGPSGGVLMEYHHNGHGDDAESVIRLMVEEAFARRGWTLERIEFCTGEHKVDRLGCAVAAALLLDAVGVESEGGR